MTTTNRRRRSRCLLDLLLVFPESRLCRRSNWISFAPSPFRASDFQQKQPIQCPPQLHQDSFPLTIPQLDKDGGSPRNIGKEVIEGFSFLPLSLSLKLKTVAVCIEFVVSILNAPRRRKQTVHRGGGGINRLQVVQFSKCNGLLSICWDFNSDTFSALVRSYYS